MFVDPFQEVDEQLAKERAEELERIQREAEAKRDKTAGKKSSQPLKVFRSGVGKYLDTSVTKVLPAQASGETPGTSGTTNDALKAKKRKVASSDGFGNFSSW